ncbi:MAG: hypothetical protein JXO72_10955 [Vicinamibacteria bacterium]|nr:hypothetical protein [Vicinamibacteria bacterium]
MRGVVFASVVITSCFIAGARADEICLKDGGCLQGVILEQTASTITIEIGPGRVTLPMGRIDRVSKGRSALMSYHERKRLLQRTDVNGWLDLARWAQDHGLTTQARSALEHVIELDPANPEANQALGKTLVGERWLDQEDAYRAKGYTLFEGAWIPREERDAMLEKRRIEADAALVEATRAEAAARRAEAEARADDAEQRAREADTATPGINGVWGWGLGGPCLTGQPCPPVRVECGPHMSGPACDVKTDKHDHDRRHKTPRVRPDPSRSATPTPNPAHSSSARKRHPKARLPDKN